MKTAFWLAEQMTSHLMGPSFRTRRSTAQNEHRHVGREHSEDEHNPSLLAEHPHDQGLALVSVT